MSKCDCYHIETRTRYTYHPITGTPNKKIYNVGVCWGTKCREECSCGGNKTKCDFYPDVKAKARKSVKTEKTGKWEICCDGYYPYCSECGYESFKPMGNYDNRTPYCPNCGAKMSK